MKTSKRSRGMASQFQLVTNRIVEVLEAHELTWNKPWISIKGGIPHNAITKEPHSALNQILLSLRQSELDVLHNGWLTLDQINELGGRVTPGETSSSVYSFKVLDDNINGKPNAQEAVQDPTEQELQEKSSNGRFLLGFSNVFNIAQTLGLPPEFYRIEDIPEANYDKAEALIELTDAMILHWEGTMSHYNFVKDEIFLPEPEQFSEISEYYGIAFRELAHWTGHESRLDRRLRDVYFYTGDFDEEELIADLCSAFICSDLGFSVGITNKYTLSWIERLKQNPQLIFELIHAAEKAANFIYSFGRSNLWKHRIPRIK